MADLPDFLGSVIPADAVVGRDAIHVAVIPVVANEELEPGLRVGIVGRKGADWLAGMVDENADPVEALGVVDPFLGERKVMPGQRFYLFLFPGTITGLRHCWQHPAFKIRVPGMEADQ